MKEYTLDELRALNQQKKSKLCAVGLFGHIYDLSKFLSSHPGGERVIRTLAGDVIDDIFEDGIHRSIKDAPGLLAKHNIHPIGVLKK